MPFSRVILTQNIVGTQQIFILIPQMRKSFGENKRATDMRFLCSNDHQLIIFSPLSYAIYFLKAASPVFITLVSSTDSFSVADSLLPEGLCAT